MAVSQTHFRNAHHVEVHNGHFMNIANSTIINQHDPVSTTLWPHVAAGAIFDSAVRYAAGKCHPGTRKKMIKRILDWIIECRAVQRILWLYGPAGAGKSALTHTICEELKESHPNVYGGSFFFASGSTDRGNAHKLFTTLSYQLAIQFPQLRDEINDVLSHDPSLPTKSMEIQLSALIVQPLLRCQTLLSQSPVLIIDGLDECADEEGITQNDIVTLIAKSILEHDLPLRFMVASRPEYWIRDAFDASPLSRMTLFLSLREDADADKDIKAYLTDGFEKIRVQNKRVMNSVELPWPPTNIIDHFVYEASGQFIYASTVLKFVGKSSRFTHPQSQLRIITSFGPHRASAFSELDRLYAKIVAAYPQWETLKLVLAGLLVGSNTTIIKTVLGVDPDELVLVLDALSSLIDMTMPESVLKSETYVREERFFESIFGNLQEGRDKISFCHRSFYEFLQDESRSGMFHIDLKSYPVPTDIVRGFFGMINRNLDQKYKIDPALFSKIDLATYCGIYRSAACSSIQHCSTSMLLQLLTDMTSNLMYFDPEKLVHMHSVFYFLRDMAGFDSILNALFFYRHGWADLGMINERKPLENACEKLTEAINIARRRSMFAILSCIDFKPTPMLVYLIEYADDRHPSYWRPSVSKLHTLTGVSDVIYSLKEHRHIFNLDYDPQNDIWSITTNYIIDINKHEARIHRHALAAWKDTHLLIIHRALKSVLNNSVNVLSMPATPSHEHRVLQRFLRSSNLSDIHNVEYLQHPYIRAILDELIQIKWVHSRLNNRSELEIMLSISHWINRQLTNTQTVALLQSHDRILQQKLIELKKLIFECGFFQPFLDRESWALVFEEPGQTFTQPQICGSSITTRFPPLFQGFNLDVDGITIISQPPKYAPHWHPFHGELLEQMAASNKLDTPSSSAKYIIDPSHWDPHLLSGLLMILVQFLYGQIHPSSVPKYHVNYRETFLYLPECLPYANPSPENLDALRAMVYLYPLQRVTPTWTPPDGFWASVVTFLQKYDHSLLSTEELNLFVKWLNSENHGDIRTYLEQ